MRGCDEVQKQKLKQLLKQKDCTKRKNIGHAFKILHAYRLRL